MPNPATVERAKKHIKHLTEIHIKRYTERVAVGENKNHPKSGAVRLDECRYYLTLWQGIATKEFEWDKLDKFEQREVIDALVDLETDG